MTGYDQRRASVDSEKQLPGDITTLHNIASEKQLPVSVVTVEDVEKFQESLNVTPEDDRRVRRKADWLLLPILMTVYGIQFVSGPLSAKPLVLIASHRWTRRA